jgi:hypothetical protein
VIRASGPLYPCVSTGLQTLQTLGLDMLPDVRFLVCGVLFCFLLFAVTGAGVRLPDARTRIGEMPELVRPMVQRSMAEAPAQSQLYMMTAARRISELDRLRERAEQEATSAQAAPQPDGELPEPAVTATRAPTAAASAADGSDSDSVMAEDAEAPVRVPAGEIARDRRPDEVAAPRVAALTPPAAAEGRDIPSQANQSQANQSQVGQFQVSQPQEGESQDGPSAIDGGEQSGLPRFVNVPLPPRRPAFFGFNRRAHLFRRRHRAGAVVQRDVPAQGAVVPGAAGQSAQGAAMQSVPGQATQGAVVQGWQAQGAVAIPSAAESAKR